MKHVVKKVQIYKQSWFCVSLVFCLALVLCLLPSVAKGQQEKASLIIYPQTGAFVKGSTFDVSVFLNTGGKNVGYVKIDLKFDPRYLQVVAPAKGLSLVSEWIFPPSFSNTSGIISLQGGFAGGGINSSEGLISVIVFQAKATGKTVINFLDSSKVFLADTRGTNILGSTNRGEYSIIPSPPKGPQISSPTHPDQNKWYRNNSPAFTWSKAEGIERFSYSLDRDPFGEPDNIADTNLNSQFFENLEDGIWYFHLKAQEGKIWGGASHFQVNIDNSPPLLFKPRLETFTATPDRSLLFYFDTVDLLSGVDYYEARIVDMSDPKNILYLGFIRTESPYRFDIERKRGTFKLIIKALDKAGNYQEGEADIRVITSNFVRAGNGFYVFGRFFPLWFPVLVLGLIVITIIGIIIWRYERRKNVRRRLERDIKEVEEGLKDIKKLEEEIKEKPTAQQRLRKAWEKLVNTTKIFSWLLVLAVVSALPSIAKGQQEGASLMIYPQTGAFVEGSTFDVYIYLNTSDNYIDVIEVNLKFDSEVLSVVSPTKEFSIVSTWTSPPSFSNSQGIVTLRGRFQDKGISVSEGLVSIVVFRAKTTGETTVSFLDSSKVILAGIETGNILNSTNIAKYDIFPSPPKGPQIFSSTHPDQNKWYKNNSPAFTFKKTRQTEGFSYSLDNDPSAEPDNIIDTTSDSCFFEGIESGVWYFHLKAKEGRVWGGTSHFRMNIDNISPSAFKPQPRAFGASLDNYLLLRFDTIDLLSGIDHYEAKLVDMSDPKNILYSAFIRVESPYRLGADRTGVFSIIIRAFDKAGNFKEGEIEIRVISPGLAIINSGIQLKGIFFPFWSIISILIIILLIVGGIIIWRVERKRNVTRQLERNIEEVEEKLEDIEKLEEKTKEKSTIRQRTREAWKRLGERVRNKNISS